LNPAEEVSLESFRASDPPGWTRTRLADPAAPGDRRHGGSRVPHG
jgi:hypothetical protein